MEYGILVAESEDGGYQVISAVDSVDEAREHIASYIIAGPDYDCIAPYEFIIVRRDEHGFYTRREVIR